MKFNLKLIIYLIINLVIFGGIYYCITNFNFNLNFSKNDLISAGFTCLILIVLLISSFHNKDFLFLAKNLLIWQILILLMVCVYTFRYDIKYAAIRLAANIFPSHSFDYGTNELVIAKNSDGHFYSSALVNGQSINFMFDTGASNIALSKQDAEKLNLDLTKLQYTKPFSTANGLSMAAPIQIQEIKLGNFIINNVDGYVMSGENNISLLGMSIISQFKNFRLEKDVLILSY